MFKHCNVNFNRFADSIKFVCKAIKVQSRVCNCCHGSLVCDFMRFYLREVSRVVPDINFDDVANRDKRELCQHI